MLTEPVIEARRSTAMPHALVERVGALTAGDCAGGPRQQPRGTDRTDAYRDTAIGHLLRCWVREHAVAEPTDSMLRLPLTTCGVEVQAPVAYWSAVGWHRFGAARIIDARGEKALVDPGLLAALLARETGGYTPYAVADLVARVAESAANVSLFLTERRARPTDPGGTTPFLSSEQALITGHPLHPAPKSRDGLSDAQLAAYSPELRGSFQLHWFAVDPAIVSTDSALPESASDLLASITRPRLQVPTGMVPIPAHPWQARFLLANAGIGQLLDAGLLRDLGSGGDLWYPTSSLRTLYRADSPVMLELSLGLRIADSRRSSLRKDLRRAVNVHRLLEAGPGAELAAAHPGFAILRDPAWLAVDLWDSRNGDNGVPDGGLHVVLRENSIGPKDLVHCVAGLVAERPGAAPSLLACLVKGLAARSRRQVSEVAREWFSRYLEAVAAPVLWLYAEHGIALEAHQQNTLVVVNGGGWPIGGRYRDTRGCCVAAAHAVSVARQLPGAEPDGDLIVEDAVAGESLVRHLGVNNLMGLIGAFGSQGLADERVLLADLRSAFEGTAARGGRVPDVIHALLDRASLCCEATLLALVSGPGELAEPLVTQSAFVEIPNPLV